MGSACRISIWLHVLRTQLLERKKEVHPTYNKASFVGTLQSDTVISILVSASKCRIFVHAK